MGGWILVLVSTFTHLMSGWAVTEGWKNSAWKSFYFWRLLKKNECVQSAVVTVFYMSVFSNEIIILLLKAKLY